MASQPKAYTRLPGRGSRGGLGVHARGSLWLGNDHLLAVTWHGYSEEYKRFYYRDIQAIVLRRTQRALWINLVLVVLLLGLGTMALLLERSTPGAWFGFSFPGSVLALLLVINLARGASCRAWLRTAVHTEELLSLNRVRVARKVLARLQPHLETAQGALSTEVVAAGLPELPAELQARFQKAQPAIRHEKGLVHLLGFGALTAVGLWTTLDYAVQSLAVTLAGVPLVVTMMVLMVIALVRQADSDVPTALKWLAFGAGGYCGLAMLLGYVQLVAVIGVDPQLVHNQWQLLVRYSQIAPAESALLRWSLMIEILGALAIGIPGLLLALRWRQTKAGA